MTTDPLNDAIRRVTDFLGVWEDGLHRTDVIHGLANNTGEYVLTVDDLRMLTGALAGASAEVQYRIVWGDDGATGPMDRARAIRKASPEHGDVIQTRTVVAPVHTDWCDTPGPGHDCPDCQS